VEEEGTVGTSISLRNPSVAQELKRLHLELNTASLGLPKFGMYEWDSPMRRSSNAAPAILAEGRGSRHTSLCIEAIDRSKGGIRETQHPRDVALARGCLDEAHAAELDAGYGICDRMPERLHQGLNEWNGSTRAGYEVRESPAIHDAAPQGRPWETAAAITEPILSGPLPPPLNLHPSPSTLRPPPAPPP